MEYTNYLTTPSGRYCQVKDITNGQYLTLVKFLQSENYKKFFECLDEIAKKSIPQLDDFDIVERCYVYIAMCMYSIRGTISVNNPLIGQQDIHLGLVVNNIESSYVRNFVTEYELKDGITLKFGYPKKFSYEGNIPVIDYFSGLIGYNDIIITQEQIQLLKSKLGTKQLSFIDDFLREKMFSNCDIFQGAVPTNKFQLNILSESLIANIVGFYNFPLQAFYKIMYTTIKHIKMSYQDFLKISHLQSTILLKIAVEQSNKANEQAKKGNINLGNSDLDE